MGDPVDKLATDLGSNQTQNNDDTFKVIDEVFDTDDATTAAEHAPPAAYSSPHQAEKPRARPSIMKALKSGGEAQTMITRHLKRLRAPLMAAVLFVLFSLPYANKIFKMAGLENPYTILIIKAAIFVIVIAIVEYI
jgi:hypothetical protein